MAKKTARGLVIRDQTIEILELVSAKGRFEVTGYGWARLADGIVRGGRVLNTKVLSDELKKLIQASRVGSVKESVVLGLAQSQVFLKVFTIPKFEEKELEEAINWHVGSLAPVLPKDGYNAYELIGKNKKNELKVLLASAQQIVVDGYLEAMELAGIEVEAIEPLALSRSRLIDSKMLVNKSIVYVHLYGGRLSVSILVSGKLWFSKESLLLNGKEGLILNEVLELIKFFSEKKDKDVVGVTDVIYNGDKQGVGVLEKNLKGMQLRVTKAEPGMVLNKSKLVSDVEAVTFAPVLGLAMRGGVNIKGLINLLPKWPKEKKKLMEIKSNFSKAVVLGGILVWLTVIGLGINYYLMKQKSRELDERINRIEVELVNRQEGDFFEWGNKFNQTVQSAELIEASRRDLSAVLQKLSELMPRTVKLTSFSYGINGKWSMSGSATNRNDVLVLDEKLKSSEIFIDANLYFSSLESSEGIVFRFNGGNNGKQ